MGIQIRTSWSWRGLYTIQKGQKLVHHGGAGSCQNKISLSPARVNDGGGGGGGRGVGHLGAVVIRQGRGGTK